MSNAEAAISVKTVYPDPNSLPDFATDFPSLPVPVELLTPHADVTLAPHTVVTVGEAIVTDGAAADDEFAFDLGDIATEVVAFTLRNNTAQDLTISINGTPIAATLPAGGVFAWAAPSGGATTPITAISVIATTDQVGDQTVPFRLFGDPS